MRERIADLTGRMRDMAGRLVPAGWASSIDAAADLLIVPQDLRSTDLGLMSEISSGKLGLAGATATIDDVSPFDVSPPTHAWSEALHGFSWLSDLRAARTDAARRIARTLVLEWIGRDTRGIGLAWRPEVVARRLLSWLANGANLVDGLSPGEYDALLRSIVAQLAFLRAHRHEARAGDRRLIAELAILETALCLSGHEDEVRAALPLFLGELDRQIVSDGGHVSRHPGRPVAILLDLLPLRQCFVARNMTPPEGLVEAIRRMVPMIRYMRLGDGGIARFNGMGVTIPDVLGTVLAFDDAVGQDLESAPVSRYVRMQRRQAVVLVDVGTPPPVTVSGEAAAGCLSFEMSSGATLLVVNNGAPDEANRAWRLNARGTAAHSTLELNDSSSSLLVRQPDIVERLGVPGISEPSAVETRTRADEDGALELQASHNGYVDRYGMIHARTLRLSAQGDRLDGVDRVYETGRTTFGRTRRSLPFAIHFHFHPDAELRRPGEVGKAEIVLPSGEIWEMVAEGAALGIEESVFLARLSGPSRAAQIVLRGQANGEAEVRWRLARIHRPGRTA
ncbi:MAG: heparinase II/III family protein [Hyphomicrobiaceae bacterium]